MVLLCDFPHELIFQVLGYLPSRSIVCVSLVSKQFHALCDAPLLWRNLCFRRWKKWNNNPQDDSPWKQLYINRDADDRNFNSLLNEYANTGRTLRKVAIERQIIACRDEGLERMTRIQTEGHRFENLTRKYYAAFMVKKFGELETLNKWKSHLASDNILFEEGATIIAQSLCDSKLQFGDISAQIEGIAIAIRNSLPQTNEIQRESDIFLALNKYFFEELGFTGFNEHQFFPSRSFIHQVLRCKKGIQITLCLIYAAVAQRLRLPIKMIGMPLHYLTRYDGEGVFKGCYIDVFHGGKILTQDDLVRRSMPIEHATINTPQEIYVRLLRNLIEEYNGTGQMESMLIALNQSIYIMPQQEELAYRIMIHANYTGKIEEAIQDLEDLIALGSITTTGLQTLRCKVEAAKLNLQVENENPPEITPKLRTPELRYSVGHTFRHVKFGYRGVIYGWDVTCQDQFDIQHSGEYSPTAASQPFYNVLIDVRDRPKQTGYVCQENIRLESHLLIYHPEIGSSFTAFRDGSYIPNARTRIEYPQDQFSNAPLNVINGPVFCLRSNQSIPSVSPPVPIAPPTCKI